MYRTIQLARQGSSVLFILLTASTVLAQPVESAAPAAALTGKAGGLTSAQVAKDASVTSHALREKQESAA